MTTRTITFPVLHGHATAKVRCLSCNAITSRSVTEQCTVNPFNTIGGIMATREQVRDQANTLAQEKAERIERAGHICAKCRLSQAEVYHHIAVTEEELDTAVKSATEITRTYEAALASALPQARSLVGKDLMVRARRSEPMRAARIMSISFDAYSKDWIVGYQFYSKKKFALPGELMGDVRYKRLSSLVKTEKPK